MIHKVTGIVTVENPSPDVIQAVTEEAERLAKKFPENNIGNLIGLGQDATGMPIAWYGRGMHKLRTPSIEKDEVFLGPDVELFVDESKLDERKKYQIPAAETASKSIEGILDVPPGGGKTVIAAILIALLRRRALVIVPTTDIANQFIATFKNLLGFEPGFIGQGKRTVKPVTIGMIQSVRSNDPVLQNVGVLIIDEAHLVSAPSYLSLLRACPAKYRIGMTGTVRKTGDEQQIVLAALGPVLFKIETGELQDQGFLNKGTYRPVFTNTVGTYFDYIAHRCYYYKNSVKKGEPAKCPATPLYKGGPVCTYPKDDEIQSCVFARGYHGWVYDKLADDEVRNKKLVAVILDEAKVHPWTIVLTHRKKHIETLMKMIDVLSPMHKVWHAMGTPEMKKKVRDKNIASYRSMGGILIAMSQAIGIGFDAPKTTCMIRAMPAGGMVAVRQQTARAMRPQEQEALVVDFVDMNIPDLKRWWFGRQSIYKSMGFKPQTKEVQKDLFANH